MYKFIGLTFLFLGWFFYEASGGADFEPGYAAARDAARAKDAATDTPEVTVAEAPAASGVAPVPATDAPAEVILASASTNTAAEAPVMAAPKKASVIKISRRELIGTIAPTPESQKATLGPTVAEATPEAAVQDDIVARADNQVFSLASSLSSANGSSAEPEFRRVAGYRVNLRTGPGREYAVIDTLTQDTQVEVMQDPGSGWVKLQTLETGAVGWMSASLLEKIELY